VAENDTAMGKVVPPDGLTGNMKVAVPPGWTDCEEPLPLVVRVKSSIVSPTAVLVTEVKLLSPLYSAVMECEPTANVVMLKDAIPAFSDAEPSGVLPSEKVTEPVGVVSEEEAVAVKVAAL